MKLLKACGIIVAGLCLVMIVDLATHLWQAPATAEQGNTMTASDIGMVASMLSVVTQGDASSMSSRAGVPDRFEDEVLSVASFTEVRMAEGGSVVGMTSDAAALETYQGCESAMAAHGWQRVESGQPTRSTFVKATGQYRWAYLECTEAAGSTAVLVALRGNEDVAR